MKTIGKYTAGHDGVISVVLEYHEPKFVAGPTLDQPRFIPARLLLAPVGRLTGDYLRPLSGFVNDADYYARWVHYPPVP